MIVGSTFSHNKIKYFSLSSKRFIHFFVPRVERIRGEDWWKIIVRKVKRVLRACACEKYRREAIL